MRTRKRFGQHFLEPAWVLKLVAAINPSSNEVFLEIGPGRGALTLALAPHVKHIVGVEVDRDLAAALRQAAPRNVTVIDGDFLDADVTEVLTTVVAGLRPGGDASPTLRADGNLPYNLSTPILFRLLKLADDGRLIRDATLMLQREVADRLAASPGSRTWGVLSACQQLRADVQMLLALPPGAFRPAPKVRSAVARLRYHPPGPEMGDPALFDALVRAIFMQRRKVLDNALEPFAASHGMAAPQALSAAGLDGRRRPETLSLRELAELAKVFASG